MDKMTRIRLKTLTTQLDAVLATCVRLDNGTDPDGQYIAEQVADKVEDQLMEIGMLLSDDEDVDRRNWRAEVASGDTVLSLKEYVENKRK